MKRERLGNFQNWLRHQPTDFRSLSWTYKKEKHTYIHISHCETEENQANRKTLKTTKGKTKGRFLAIMRFSWETIMNLRVDFSLITMEAKRWFFLKLFNRFLPPACIFYSSWCLSHLKGKWKVQHFYVFNALCHKSIWEYSFIRV